MDVKYTICFIKRNEQLLLLYRLKAPNIHKWNGVGGKIEIGEEPLTSIKREVMEETGLTLVDPTYRGIVSWNNEAGMHVYAAEQFNGDVLASEEGPLEWKSIQWIRESSEVVSNIPIFLEHLFNNEPPVEYAFTYDETGRMIDYKKIPLLNSQHELSYTS